MPEAPKRAGPVARLAQRLRSRRYVVRDDSMRPAFVPGDRLYVDPRPRAGLAVGDAVVLRDPERPGAWLLKRVVELSSGPGPAAVMVRGDNGERSRDSRHFGPRPPGEIVGVVWFRYAPDARRGPIARRPLK